MGRKGVLRESEEREKIVHFFLLPAAMSKCQNRKDRCIAKNRTRHGRQLEISIFYCPLNFFRLQKAEVFGFISPGT